MHDWQLLREYIEHNSQTAFATLVERHANLVYSTCLRETGNAALAEDVAQVVFVILARKAASLREEVVLAGWLFQTARFSSKNALKQEQRRQQREQKAAEQMMSESEANPGWANVEPLLHAGLVSLGTQDRDALLLRFFENRSLRDTGAALGISEDAARMRVTRALEKLRRHFARHGFAASVAVLAALLSEHAVQAAPASCVLSATRLSGLSAPASSISAHALSPKIAALSHEVLRALLLKKLGVAAGLGVLMLMSGGALSQVVKHAALGKNPGAPVNDSAPNSVRKSAASPTAKPISPTVAIPAQSESNSLTAPTAKLTNSPKLLRKSPLIKRDLDNAARLKPQRAAVSARMALPELTQTLVVARPVAAETNSASPITKPIAISPPEVPDSQDALPDTLPAPSDKSEATPNPAADAPVAAPPNETLNTHRVKRDKAKRREALKASGLRGRLMSINESDDSIIIKPPGADAKTVTLPSGARFFLDNKAANLEDIQPGMSVKIRVKDGALAIHARAPLGGSAQVRAGEKSPKEGKKKSNKFPFSTP